jgi:hypothetical protein
MIELFNGSTAVMTDKFFSVKDTSRMSGAEPTTGAEGDFCACRFQCIPDLPFLTDNIGTDTSKNDFFTIFMNLPTGGTIQMYVIIDGVETLLSDATYGSFYNGIVFKGYEFSAFKIWQLFGACTVSAVARAYSSGGYLISELYQNNFKLALYTDRTAHGTITIETLKNGKLRHGADYSNLKLTPSGGAVQFLLGWRQQIRIPGSLKFSGMPIETDRLMLNDKKQSSLQVMDTGTFEYDLTINLVSSDQILPILLDDLFANTVYVSDFNLLNFEIYRKVRLIRQSVDFSPSKRTRRKNFTFKMKRETNDIEKFND